MSIWDKTEAALWQYIANVYTGKTQASDKNKASVNAIVQDVLKSYPQPAAPAPAPAPAPPPAPEPIQLAPVMDMVSTIMTPKQATPASPTGGDGANKQAYGGDIATLRPVANAGDTGGTMLTGPVGVDPDQLLLAKKTLLGA